MTDMHRRTFMRVGAGAVAATMLPLQGCTTTALPPLQRATGALAFGADGTRYEALPFSHALAITSPAGQQKRVGGLGRGAGQLNFPSGVAVLDDKVYVVDTGNHRVEVFDAGGGHAATIGLGELLYPAGIAAYADRIFVTDTSRGRVIVMDPHGSMLAIVGAGELSAPVGITYFGDSLVLADPGLGRVVTLDDSGHIARDWGNTWILPRGVASDGESLFVADVARSVVAVVDRGGSRSEIVIEAGPRFVGFGPDGTLYYA
jgi:DNA-binding beta-propeller fold protein YncE